MVQERSYHSHQSAILALILLVGAASLGIAARLYLAGWHGYLLFIGTRIWILVLPLIWFLGIERGKLVLTWPTWRDLQLGTALGLLMAGAIGGAYWFLGQGWIDSAQVQAKAQQVGLMNPLAYLGTATYFTVINAFVEEYVWRWFVYRKWETLVPGVAAIYLAAFCFTLHHIIALVAYTGNAWVVVLGSLGVFGAGAIWCGCFLTYRSLWACYVSHLLADGAIALVGWHLLFRL